VKVSGQLHAPAALPPRKEPPVPIGEEVGWTSEPVWMIWRRENSWNYRDSNSDPLVVQSVASRYTDELSRLQQWSGICHVIWCMITNISQGDLQPTSSGHKIMPQTWRLQVPSKLRYTSNNLHGFTSEKAAKVVLTVVGKFQSHFVSSPFDRFAVVIFKAWKNRNNKKFEGNVQWEASRFTLVA
jgi:hypothetical protein